MCVSLKFGKKVIYNQKQNKICDTIICLLCALYTTVNLNSYYIQNIFNEHCISSQIYALVIGL